MSTWASVLVCLARVGTRWRSLGATWPVALRPCVVARPIAGRRSARRTRTSWATACRRAWRFGSPSTPPTASSARSPGPSSRRTRGALPGQGPEARRRGRRTLRCASPARRTRATPTCRVSSTPPSRATACGIPLPRLAQARTSSFGPRCRPSCPSATSRHTRRTRSPSTFSAAVGRTPRFSTTRGTLAHSTWRTPWRRPCGACGGRVAGGAAGPGLAASPLRAPLSRSGRARSGPPSAKPRRCGRETCGRARAPPAAASCAWGWTSWRMCARPLARPTSPSTRPRIAGLSPGSSGMSGTFCSPSSRWQAPRRLAGSATRPRGRCTAALRRSFPRPGGLRPMSRCA